MHLILAVAVLRWFYLVWADFTSNISLQASVNSFNCAVKFSCKVVQLTDLLSKLVLTG